MLDNAHKTQLENIFIKAVNHAEKCIEEGSPHMGAEWMSIARDADHIIRKHEYNK